MSKGVTWDYGGVQVPVKWALAICHHVGWRGRDITRAVALMWAESGRWTQAWHVNPNKSIDRGLFQVNSIHDSQIKPEDTMKPLPNAQYAYKLWTGAGWRPWMAYGGPRYLAYLSAVHAVRALGTWKSRISRVEGRWS